LWAWSVKAIFAEDGIVYQGDKFLDNQTKTIRGRDFSELIDSKAYGIENQRENRLR
jgi:hypothetical protein